MLMTTTDVIEGKELKTLGHVEGSATRAKHLGNDILASLRGLVGGEISEYTKLLSDTREQAFKRMENAAQEKGADAVVGLRVTTSTIAAGVSEILVYGTAVSFKS